LFRRIDVMRKLVPLCLVTLAMTVSACGDDEGAIVPTDTPDGSAETTTKEDSGPGEATTETTSSEEATSTAAATDAGEESSTAVVVDAGGDGSTEPPTEVDAGGLDSGVTSEPTTDGGPVAEVDAGDGGGPVELTPCEAACARAEEVSGCTDFSTCATDLCGMYDASENCDAEVDAYLACVAENAEQSDFTCTDDKPTHSGAECDDPYLYDWLTCLAQ
jgi:hypothetical protein